MFSAALKVSSQLEITTSMDVRGEEEEKSAVSLRIVTRAPGLHVEGWWLPGGPQR